MSENEGTRARGINTLEAGTAYAFGVWMNKKDLLGRIRAAAFLTGAVLLGGCTAEATPAVESPSDVTMTAIEASPYVIYKGQAVHLYSGRWYFRDGHHWAYYRNVPPDLDRLRPYVQPARPAPPDAPPPNDGK